MREMGFVVGRKHADRLRLLALAAGFAGPVLALMLSLIAGPVVALALAVLAVASMTVGLLTERWLFFAQAQHVVTVFYGSQAA